MRTSARSEGACEAFIADCEHIQKLSKKKLADAKAFIAGLLKLNVDARIFEIISFAVLKKHYSQESIFWGWTEDDLRQEFLMLYKTGRCNANDGGIDSVMRPLGRFFQVTETTDDIRDNKAMHTERARLSVFNVDCSVDVFSLFRVHSVGPPAR